MLISHAVPHTRGCLYLPARVREWLQLPRTCRLFCRLADDAGDPYLVISPVPIAYWDRCFRVWVNTNDEPGSLHTVLTALETNKLNILHMIASATSAAGEVSVTAIVTPGSEVDSTTSPDDVARQLQNNLSTDSALQSKLSRSVMFSSVDKYSLRSLLVRPLLALRALKLVPLRGDGLKRQLGDSYSAEFSYDMTNSKIDLSAQVIAPSDPTNRSPLAPIHCMQSHRTRESMSVLLTADVNECNLRLCLLPEKNFIHIKVPLHASANNDDSFRGLTKEVIGVLAKAPTMVNIYHAANFTASSTALAAEGSPRLSENIDIRIIGDASAVYSDSDYSSVHNSLKKSISDRIQMVSTPDRPVNVRQEGISVRPLLAPLVFTATNVKHSMPLQFRRLANELFAELKDMHLRPIFLDTLGGKGYAKDQMARLLDACPLLVSLYLPEVGNELKEPNPDSPFVKYAASVWTAFEEAYISAKKGRAVYRLIHKSVFPPPFVDRALEFSFSDGHEFREALGEVRKRIQADRLDPEWPALLRSCSEAFDNGRLTPEEIGGRDPEGWLATPRDSHLVDALISKGASPPPHVTIVGARQEIGADDGSHLPPPPNPR